MIKITIQQTFDGKWVADFVFGNPPVEQSWAANTFENVVAAIPSVLNKARNDGYIQSQEQFSGKS